MDVADYLELDLAGTYITLDSGFDSQDNKDLIAHYGLTPCIKPNPRGIKDQEKLNTMYEEFGKIKHIYKERYRVERSFAWQDTYRKLVIRYEKLQCTFLGFRYLAYSMINLRSFFHQ